MIHFLMWEIAENLHRADLTVLERDEQVARWVEIVDEKAGQSAHVSGGRGNVGGLSAASRELGVERTDARRATKVAALTPVIRALCQNAIGECADPALVASFNALSLEERVDLLASEIDSLDASRRRQVEELLRPWLPHTATETREVLFVALNEGKGGWRSAGTQCPRCSGSPG